MTGIVFDIKKFTVHDGPGIRTTVFMKGCPLRCVWCHNPESISPRPVLAQFPRNCIGCGKCLTNCPNGALSLAEATEDGGRDARPTRPTMQIVIDRVKCGACGACAKECYAEALVLQGKEMSVEEVIAEVEKDRPFYDNSGGGMTLSGGEPLFQLDFTEGLLKLAKERGLHTVLDTCGFVGWPAYERVLPYVDLVLFDIKGVDPARHLAHTGQDNAVIHENLRRMLQAGQPVMVRVPTIPGHNATIEDAEALARFLLSLPRVPPVELLRYHRLGEGKYASLGLPEPALKPDPPSEELMQELCGVLANYSIQCTSGG
jgi:pyruvate formate lyase activating enzyme